MKAKELVDELNRRVTDGASFTDKILCARAATLIEAQAKAIEELGGAFQGLGLMLVSEAAVASRPGQMESLEALANDAFLRARQATSHSKDGEQ